MLVGEEENQVIFLYQNKFQVEKSLKRMNFWKEESTTLGLGITKKLYKQDTKFINKNVNDLIENGD